VGPMSSLGRLAPRLRPLVAKPRGGDGGGGSGRAWIPAAMHGALYVVLSASLVLSNKHLIVNTHTPILIASLGSLFGTIVAWTLVGVGHVKLKTRLTMHQWVTYILPIGACTAVSLAFANLALTYIRLSLAQMAKAFAPAVTAAALVSLKLDRTFDERCARAVCVIVFGCVVAAWGALDGQPHAWIGLVSLFFILVQAIGLTSCFVHRDAWWRARSRKPCACAGSSTSSRPTQLCRLELLPVVDKTQLCRARR
jgi:hypothetical protein